MSADETNRPAATGDGTNHPAELKRPGRTAQIFRAVQVRLRFVIVLATAFLVVGLWGNLRNHWDTWWHRLAGSHSIEHAVSLDTEYFCPMCPGVVSDWPAICPVCSMDLVRRKKGDAALLPEGVVARMQLSPYRIQLAGIATSVIENRPLVRDVVLGGYVVVSPAKSAASESPEGDSPLVKTSELALECQAAASDLPLLAPGREAHVTLDNAGAAAVLAGHVELAEREPDAVRGRRASIVFVRLAGEAAWVRPGMTGTARISVPLSEIEPFASLSKGSGKETNPGFAAVPESAIVDTGSRRVAFVETMPGMFDGVEVTLGPRCGDYYPVVKGLEAGQKVAAVGAFLIDAEARLSPDLAAAYFGAARTAAPATAAGQPTAKRSRKQSAKLSADDEKLVKQQKICPVTEADLDSMGGPVAVEIAGRRVFLCCKACEKAIKADPQKYLAKLNSNRD